MIKGQLNTPTLVTLFGEGLFDYPLPAPWEDLFNHSRPDGNIATGIRQAWSHLTTNFQEVVLTEQRIDTSKCLLARPVTGAGFHADGTMPGSVTNTVTVELEKQRSMHLGAIVASSLNRNDYEHWSWDGCTKMSAAFLTSPPDAIGYLGDNVFQVSITMYLCQPCPIIAPVVGRFFGRN